MFKLLHTADLHLDRSFAGQGMVAGIAARRRQELRDAFRRFIDLALERRVDAVTIGGDLYEHERLTLDTGNFLRGQFQRLGATPVFIAPGNHDPYVPDSLYRRIEWPPNVVIFGRPELEPRTLAPGVTLWGAGHDGPELRRNLVAGFRVGGGGRHLLLFHGSDVRSVPEGKTAHCPFAPEDVAASGADFALLGHYHAPRLYPSERPYLGYPGSPEALDFSEEGAHCVLEVQVGEDRVRAELLPFGRVRYRTHRLDVSDLFSSEDLRQRILALGDGEAIVRVVLEGQLQPDVDLDIEALYNACAERFAYLDIVDRTTAAYNLAALAEESTTKGAFVRLMRERIARLSGEERQIAVAALHYGLQAFDKREVRVN